MRAARALAVLLAAAACGHAQAPSAAPSVGEAGGAPPAATKARTPAAVAQVRNCYEARLSTRPTLSGRLEYDWVVQPDGRVTDVRLVSTTANDPQLETCIARALGGWRFPPPKDGKAAEVRRYPFTFEAAE